MVAKQKNYVVSQWNPSGEYWQQLWAFSVGDFYLEAESNHPDGWDGLWKWIMYLLQEMTAVENAHYLSGRRRNNLDGVQGLKLLLWMNYTGSALENVDSNWLRREIKISANTFGRLTSVEIRLGTPNNKSLVFTQWEECQLFLKSES